MKERKHTLHWDQFKLSVHALVRALLDLFCMSSTLCVTVECTIVVISALMVFSYFGSFSLFRISGRIVTMFYFPFSSIWFYKILSKLKSSITAHHSSALLRTIVVVVVRCCTQGLICWCWRSCQKTRTKTYFWKYVSGNTK